MKMSSPKLARFWRNAAAMVMFCAVAAGAYTTGRTAAQEKTDEPTFERILIDQAIVVIDNIECHMRMDKGPLQASWEGTQEVAVPLFVSTATFIVVFFPVIFLSGLAKYLFTPLSLAVVFSVVASYLIAIFFGLVQRFEQNGCNCFTRNVTICGSSKSVAFTCFRQW